MRAATYALLTALTIAGACKSPATKYRLSAEQLDWQPYQEGQRLRFRSQQTGAVRTYRVSKVADTMVEYGGFCLCAFTERPQFEQRTAMLLDSTGVYGNFEALYLSLGDKFNITGVSPHFEATTEWDGGGQAQLPIEEVNASQPFDTTAYSYYRGVELLTNYSLGPATYDKVLRARLGFGPATAVYHVKGRGVVAFEDQHTGLWYRLP